MPIARHHFLQFVFTAWRALVQTGPQPINVGARRAERHECGAEPALQPYPDRGALTIVQADAWRKYANRYGSLAGLRPDANFYSNSTKLSPLYTSADRAAWAKGSALTVTTLWPRLAEVSFASVQRLAVPVAFLLGRRDKTTPSEIAAGWLGRLAAPSRTLCSLENSGHLPMIEEPGRTLAALLLIRARTSGRESAAADLETARSQLPDSGR